MSESGPPAGGVDSTDGPGDGPIGRAMARALELAARGEGLVEPNPMVGCVVLRDGEVVGEGWHERFGGPHAEVNALAAAGDRARGATLVVTLEPCCHVGKTPPCVEAVLAAGVRRVVIACRDTLPKVDGGGIATLEARGVACVVGPGEAAARTLMAPYMKLVTTGRPWVLAKWAMTLDGKIATRTGDSQWISGPESRAEVHRLRGRMDAVVVGAGTCVADDPRLTARPADPADAKRTPLRIVIAADRPLPLERQLWRTPEEGPVLVAHGADYPEAELARLRDAGVETLAADSAQGIENQDVKNLENRAVERLLDELGRRRLTNVLVEGGGKLLGRMIDAELVDEAHVFIAPKLLGGATAAGPVAGLGIDRLADAAHLQDVTWRQLGDDLYLRGRIPRDGPTRTA